MALRQLGRALRGLSAQAEGLRGAAALAQTRSYGAVAHHEGPPAHTPTAFDKLVTLSVVDLAGRRHQVRGLVGQSLAQALIEAGFPETYFFPNMVGPCPFEGRRMRRRGVGPHGHVRMHSQAQPVWVDTTDIAPRSTPLASPLPCCRASTPST